MSEGDEGFDAARVEARLRRPLVPREEGVFRLGLALNGTASTAAWTAGALDFLVEALDFWEDKKRADRERGDGRPTVPDHGLKVGITGGASGGGLCAALLARAAGWEFPHAADADAPGNGANPFWRVLVEDLDAARMLDPPDLAGQAPRVSLRRPAWDALEPPAGRDLPYWFDGVDGGALDNRLVELVRTALSGLGGSNPRGPREAHTSVLLLDPCAVAEAGGASPGDGPPRDLCGVLGGLAAAWTGQGRCSAADLLLALDPGVCSRFLLTARRERGGRPRHGAAALAAAGMGGFLGFLRRELRAHDYMMGRENCRSFLMHELVLHEDNPVFRGFASRHPAAAEEYRPRPGRPGWLPIVPVAEHLRVPRLLPEWPRGALDPDRLAAPMERRFGPLLRRLLDRGGLDGGTAARELAGAAAARVRETLKDGALG